MPRLIGVLRLEDQISGDEDEEEGPGDGRRGHHHPFVLPLLLFVDCPHNWARAPSLLSRAKARAVPPMMRRAETSNATPLHVNVAAETKGACRRRPAGAEEGAREKPHRSEEEERGPRAEPGEVQGPRARAPHERLADVALASTIPMSIARGGTQGKM